MPVSPFLGELFGTMILILLGNGVVGGVLLNKSKAQNSGWIVITAGWAFAVMCGVFAAAAFGAPGELNPAVTVANIIRAPETASAGIMRIVAQFIGAFIGATLVWLHYMPHWSETEDQGLKLACYSTGPAIRNPATNLVSEIIGTFVLVQVVFSIFSAAATGDTGPSAGVGPYLVAALVWGIGLSLGGPTGYAINPARDLGPRIAHFLLPIAGKGDLGLELFVDPGGRPADRRRAIGDHVAARDRASGRRRDRPGGGAGHRHGGQPWPPHGHKRSGALVRWPSMHPRSHAKRREGFRMGSLSFAFIRVPSRIKSRNQCLSALHNRLRRICSEEADQLAGDRRQGRTGRDGAGAPRLDLSTL